MLAGAFSDIQLSRSAASQSVMRTKWIRADKENPLWHEKKGSLKGTKQTFNSHNKDKVKRTRAVKKSAVEGCHSRQSLRDVQQRKYSAAVLSPLRHVQSFRGRNKRTQRLNKLFILGYVGNITAGSLWSKPQL